MRGLLGLTLLVSTLLQTCGGDDVPVGGTLKMAGIGGVDTLDPGGSYYTITWSVLFGVVRTLVTIDAESRVVPDLATDAGSVSADGRTWTFHLKSGVRFGKALGPNGPVSVSGVTGAEIRSEDVRYAIERLFTPTVPAAYAFYYGVIEGAEAFAEGNASSISGIQTPDERTIVFRLTQPVGDFPYRLALPAAGPVPKAHAAAFDAHDPSDYADHIVSSGPYVVAVHRPEELLRMERNEDWDPDTDDVREANVDAVEWTMGLPDSEQIVQGITSGAYDLGMDVFLQGELLEQLLNGPNLLSDVSGGTTYAWFNVAEPPFDDLLVRQAVNYGVNRRRVRNSFGDPEGRDEMLGQAAAEVATSILPPTIPGSLSAQVFNPFATPNDEGDVSRARQLMAQAGYPDGYTAPLRMVSSEDPRRASIADSIHADLLAIGFQDVRVQLVPPDEMYGMYGDPSTHVLFGTGGGWFQDYPDASSFFEPLFTPGAIGPESCCNFGQVDDASLTSAIAQASVLPAGQQRTQAWEAVNRMATEKAFWVPLLHPRSNIVHSEALVNVVYHQALGHADWINAGLDR